MKVCSMKVYCFIDMKVRYMKFLTGIVLAMLLPFISMGQCPVINTAMINACAQPPSTAEGINEFVYFTTTAAAPAGNYKLSYGTANPPLGGGSTNTMSGANAVPQNGTGSLLSTNGCTITYVTSPATVIPANSGVILIPSNFDNTYDLTGICTGTTLYAVLVDVTAAPSNTWNQGGTFANNSGASPRYLQVSNGGSNCASGIVSYNGNGWPANVDGNSVWWAGTAPNYQNNGCSMIKPPKPTITPSPIAAVCQGSTSVSMPFTLTGNPNQFSIDWDNAANTAGLPDVGATVLPASPLSISLPATLPAGTYNGSISAINSLTPDTSIAQSITVTVNPKPVITRQPPLSLKGCLNISRDTISVAVDETVGAPIQYQWFLLGSSGVAVPFPGAVNDSFALSSANLGTIRFFCRITNSFGCINYSDTTSLTINANPATPVAGITQQPNCITPTGTITVVSPTGPSILYSSADTSGPFVKPGVFTGLTPGATYNIVAKDTATGCVSPIRPLTIDPLPASPTVTAGVTQQPTCSAPTGTITVTAPLGNYEYSVGSGYQPTLVFSGLNNSTVYNVTVRDITTGCISAPLPLTINPIAGAPAIATIGVAQTNCNNTSGTITIVAPINSNYEYSVGGAYQNTLVFAGLTAGTAYHVTVRDITTGCISAPVDTSMDALPVLTPPAIATPVYTYCENETATALSAATTFPGAVLQWYSSLTGGTASAIAPTPVTTAAGTFKFYVSQKNGACESGRDSITVTVNPTPAVPGTAGNTTTYCENEVAIVLTATGSNLQWYNTATGGTPLPGGAPTPSTFSAGNTTYYVSQTVNGCESNRAAITVTVNPIPAAPAVANPLLQYCLGSTPAALTATGSNLLWYTVATGGLGTAAAPSVSTASSGTTFYYVSQTVNGCESGRSFVAVTIVAIPTSPVTAPVDYCLNATATPLTATGVNLQWYSTLTAVTALPGAPAPLTNTAGVVTYYVSQSVNGCESPRDSVVVTVKPISPAPAVISPLEYCQNSTAPQLTATGTSLLWYSAATGGTGSSTAPAPNTATPGTAFFYVTQNVNGCESNPRTAITVTVKVTGTAVAGFHYTKDTACINGLNQVPAYDLGFTNGGVFSASPSGLNIDPATGIITAAASAAGAYRVTYTYPTTGCTNGNTGWDSIVVAPAIPATVVFSYSSPVCKDALPVMPQTVPGFTTGGLFTAPPGVAINTSTGEINIANSSPGTNYQVTYSLPEFGCRLSLSGFAFISITDTSSPVTKFNYNTTEICLTGSPANPVLTKATGFTPGGTFTATPSGLSINNTTGDINIASSAAGTYTIKYSVPALGCRRAGADSVLLQLRAYGTAVTAFSYTGPVCKNAADALAITDPNLTPGGKFSSITGAVVDSSTGTVNIGLSSAAAHTVRYDVPQGACNPSGFSTANIVILPLPPAPAVTPGSICGQGTVQLAAAAAGTITWYTEPQKINAVNTGSIFSVTTDRTLSYYVTNTAASCESEPAIVSAIVNPLPPKPFLGKDTSICADDRIILRAGVYASYLWQDGSSGSTYTVTLPGNYKVIVGNNAGCKDSAAITVYTLGSCGDIYFPNAFAPNGSVNKNWGAAGNLFAINNYVLKVYNRYGEEVFATGNPAARWDGTYKGKPVNVGAFAFVATYVFKNKINRVQKGTVIVLR